MFHLKSKFLIYDQYWKKHEYFHRMFFFMNKWWRSERKGRKRGWRDEKKWKFNNTSWYVIDTERPSGSNFERYRTLRKFSPQKKKTTSNCRRWISNVLLERLAFFISLSFVRRSFLLSYASFSSFSLFLPPRLVFDTRQYCDHSFSTLSLLLLLRLVLVNSIGNERSRRVWIVEIDRVLCSPSTKRRPFDLFTFFKSWLTESKQLPSRILVFLVCQT